MAEYLMTSYDVPDAIKESLKDHIPAMIRIAPSWLRCLHIEFSATSSGTTAAEILVHYKYRDAHLKIYPGWLNTDEQRRKEIIFHESVHLLTAPVHEWISETLNDTIDDMPRLLKAVQSGWRIANEAVTEDISNMLIQAVDDAYDRGRASALNERAAEVKNPGQA